MNQHYPGHERYITNFADRLRTVVGPDDMFPPEARSFVAPMPGPRPVLPTAEALSLVAVYDLAAARQRREQLQVQSAQMIACIDRVCEVEYV